jgi:hypothetical protein
MLTVAFLSLLLSPQFESVMSEDPKVASAACLELMTHPPEPHELADLLSMDHLAFSGDCFSELNSGRVVLLDDADLSIPENQVFLIHSPPSIADIAVCLIVSSRKTLSSRFSDRETCATFVGNEARAEFLDELAQAIIERRGEIDLHEIFNAYDVHFVSLEHHSRDHLLVKEQMNPGTFYCHAGEACTHFAVKVKETVKEAQVNNIRDDTK